MEKLGDLSLKMSPIPAHLFKISSLSMYNVLGMHLRGGTPPQAGQRGWRFTWATSLKGTECPEEVQRDLGLSQQKAAASEHKGKLAGSRHILAEH